MYKDSIEEMIDWLSNFGPNYDSGDGYIATQIALKLRAMDEALTRQESILRAAEELAEAVEKHWAGDGYALSEALETYRKAGETK